MKLKRDQYYFCSFGKDPDISKLRRYCTEVDCPNLRTRKRKKPAKKRKIIIS